VRGVSCIATAKAIKVTKWSMGGVHLTSSQLLVAKIPDQGLRRPPLGIIGSDVLSRFGAIRVDYGTKKLLLAEPEAAAPAVNTYITGRKTTPIPAALVVGTVTVSTPLRVLESPTGTQVVASVTVGAQTEQFTVDSGSVRSAISSSVAATLNLVAGKGKQALSGVGCGAKGSVYASGPWAVAGATLAVVPLTSRAFAGTANAGISGVLGSDVLATEGSLVVDYQSAYMWLAKG